MLPDPFTLSLLGLYLGEVYLISDPTAIDTEDPGFNLDTIVSDKSAWT